MRSVLLYSLIYYFEWSTSNSPRLNPLETPIVQRQFRYPERIHGNSLVGRNKTNKLSKRGEANNNNNNNKSQQTTTSYKNKQQQQQKTTTAITTTTTTVTTTTTTIETRTILKEIRVI